MRKIKFFAFIVILQFTVITLGQTCPDSHSRKNLSSIEEVAAQLLTTQASKDEIPKAAIEQAFKYIEKYPSKFDNKKYMTIVDFTKPSSEERMFVINLATGEVEKYLVAHGQGGHNGFPSTGNYVKAFSNVENSYLSSPGFYVAAERYIGSHGLSLRLEGQEKGVNDNARSRSIVIHGANYVDPDLIRAQGRIGRSQGCPAVEPRYVKRIISKLEGNSLLYIYNGQKS